MPIRAHRNCAPPCGASCKNYFTRPTTTSDRNMPITANKHFRHTSCSKVSCQHTFPQEQQRVSVNLLYAQLPATHIRNSLTYSHCLMSLYVPLNFLQLSVPKWRVENSSCKSFKHEPQFSETEILARSENLKARELLEAYRASLKGSDYVSETSVLLFNAEAQF